MKEKVNSRKIQITLTDDEYQTLNRLSELKGRPMAALFLEVIRETDGFVVLRKMVKANEKIVSLKGDLKKNMMKYPI